MNSIPIPAARFMSAQVLPVGGATAPKASRAALGAHPCANSWIGVSADTLRSLVDYDPDTGVFTWKDRPVEMFPSRQKGITWNKKHAGKVAFSGMSADGLYYCGKLFNRTLRAHRVAWLHYFGEEPEGIIDHINRNGLDNRIANLRLANLHESACNRSSSGEVPYLGVQKARNKFRARVKAGDFKWSKTFDTAEEAAMARDQMVVKLHGEFAALNFMDTWVSAPHRPEPVARDYSFKAVIGECPW